MNEFEQRRLDINSKITSTGVRKYEVAKEIGIAEQTFSKKLREPTKEFQEDVEKAIRTIVSKRLKEWGKVLEEIN